MRSESDRSVSNWLSQVAQALRAGQSAAESVHLAGGISRRTTDLIRERLEDGEDWSSALGEEAGFLSEAELAVLGAAARAGKLPEAMERLAEQRDSRHRMRRMLLLGSLYPFALLHFVIAIIPASRLMDGDYAGYAVTALMIFLPFWAVLLLGAISFKLLPASVDRTLRLLPLLGGYARLKSLSTLSSVLATALESGLRIDEAWGLASRSTGSSRFERLGERVLREIGAGSEVAPVLSEFRWLPEEFASGYRTAEKSGNLDTFLERISERYRDEASTRLKLAIGTYTGGVFLLAMGLAAWQIVSFYSEYFERIGNIEV